MDTTLYIHSITLVNSVYQEKNQVAGFLIFCFILHFLQIILTVAEHHSAIVPWQLVAQKTGAVLKFVGLTTEETPDTNQLLAIISRKTKLVVVHHVSNVLGRSI